MRLLAFTVVGFMAANAAHGQPLVRQQQQVRCEAEMKALSQKGQAGVPNRAAFMKTCMSDVNAVAALPGDVTMQAPAGATGVCKDGSYTAARQRDAACGGHHGLAHWLS